MVDSWIFSLLSSQTSMNLSLNNKSTPELKNYQSESKLHSNNTFWGFKFWVLLVIFLRTMVHMGQHTSQLGEKQQLWQLATECFCVAWWYSGKKVKTNSFLKKMAYHWAGLKSVQNGVDWFPSYSWLPNAKGQGQVAQTTLATNVALALTLRFHTVIG